MAGHNQNKSRGNRRDLRKRFDTLIDVERFAYEKRTGKARAEAKLYGVVTAGLLYGLGFTGGYAAWTNGTMPFNQFSMLTWMWMVPATFVGILVWKIVGSRREYPVRQEIRRYIADIESDGGLIWRFAPLLDTAELERSVIGRVIELSRAGRVAEIAIEDYASAVGRIAALLNADGNIIRADSIHNVQRNLDNAV